MKDYLNIFQTGNGCIDYTYPLGSIVGIQATRTTQEIELIGCNRSTAGVKGLGRAMAKLAVDQIVLPAQAAGGSPRVLVCAVAPWAVRFWDKRNPDLRLLCPNPLHGLNKRHKVESGSSSCWVAVGMALEVSLVYGAHADWLYQNGGSRDHI